MPLRDHLHPPVSERTPWEAVHSGWPMVIVQHLDRVLPDRHAAAPRVHRGARWEVDAAAPDRDVGRPPEGDEGVTKVWAPSAPTLAVETELDDQDEYEVRVYDARPGRRLVAAVELVGPANKDRPESRAQFVAKCAAMIRRHVSVVLVDLVTSRSTNLYAELLDLIGEHDPALGDDPRATYATACLWRPHGVSRWLEAWNRPLAVGQPLPELPLWLNDEYAVPLDLEASYEQTCRDLRIP